MPDRMDKIKQIKKKHEKSWLSIEDVVAVGIGITSDNKPGIIISVKKQPQIIRQQIPAQIDNIKIDIQETGEIKAT
jgi:hypothetical protein